MKTFLSALKSPATTAGTPIDYETTTRVEQPALLWNEAQVCQALSVGKSTLYARISAGAFPPPLKIAGTLTKPMNRWPVDELRRWVAAGCPHYATWAGKRGR
jgi:predicted DNA-binding transcriptional regulator AlpA